MLSSFHCSAQAQGFALTLKCKELTAQFLVHHGHEVTSIQLGLLGKDVPRCLPVRRTFCAMGMETVQMLSNLVGPAAPRGVRELSVAETCRVEAYFDPGCSVPC